MIKNKEAEILLLGLPNSGKSTLINALTKNKTSIIGSKPNTTRDKISKFVTYENDKNILISDLPGFLDCLLYTSPSPRDTPISRMPSSA